METRTADSKLLWQRAASFIAITVAILFAISGIVYLWLGHWPVTHEDGWVGYERNLTAPWVDQVLEKYNEHPSVVPAFVGLIIVHWLKVQQEPLFVTALLFMLITAALFILPVWQDRRATPMCRGAAVVLISIGTFWMIRGEITASGSFNIVMSLVMLGAAAALLAVSRFEDSGGRWIGAAAIVTFGGFIASFAFGGGLAVWPMLLIAAWCLRLPRRAYGVIFGAAIVAALIFKLLPEAKGNPTAGFHGLPLQAVPGLIVNLCELVGAPIAHGVAGWGGYEPSQDFATAFAVARWSGAIGVLVGGAILIKEILQRRLRAGSVRYSGIGALSFTLFLLTLVSLGRLAHFHEIPSEVLAPRFLFWSTMFWAGLGVTLVALGDRYVWSRICATVACLLLPVAVWPSHAHEGAHFRYVRYRADFGAVALINGVHDVGQVTILSIYENDVFRVAKLFRKRRLDMFREGLQNWIGKGEHSLLGGRQRSEQLTGDCRIDGLLSNEEGRPAARVSGWTLKHAHDVPRRLVIVDSSGAVAGIGETAHVTPLQNRFLYNSIFPPTASFGYIKDYDPGKEYFVRSADDGALSEEEVSVQKPAAVTPAR